MDEQANFDHSGRMLFAAAGLVLLLALLTLWVRSSWYKSVWRTDQIASLSRIDSLIRKVDDLADQAESGLERSQIGNLKGDWADLHSELQTRHGFSAWWKGGRMSHTLEDRQAQALFSLAFKRVKPLLLELSTQEGRPLNGATLDHIFEVLSVNLEDLASSVVTISPGSSEAGSTSSGNSAQLAS